MVVPPPRPPDGDGRPDVHQGALPSLSLCVSLCRADLRPRPQLAQWAGSRTDLFPAELCTLFGRLHSQGGGHSFRYTKRVIERAFGLPFAQIFAEFREEPLGIGAIAQVYRAVLNPDLLPEDYLTLKHVEDPAPTARLTRTIAPRTDDKRPPRVPGATVAIKVLHPGVEKKIRRDLKIMMFFAKALNALPGMEWLSFPEEVQVFGEMMMSQVDLRIEANNLGPSPSLSLSLSLPRRRAQSLTLLASIAVTFEKFFMHRPTVSFPRALKQYTAPRVLVEEFEDAVPLEAFLQNGGGAFDHRIANLGLDAFLVRRPPLPSLVPSTGLTSLALPCRTCSSSTTLCTRTFTCVPLAAVSRATSLTTFRSPAARRAPSSSRRLDDP